MRGDPTLTGSEVRSRRLAAGMSRQQLAMVVGVDAGVVADWESGERTIECQSAVRQALASASWRRDDSREEAR